MKMKVVNINTAHITNRFITKILIISLLIILTLIPSTYSSHLTSNFNLSLTSSSHHSPIRLQSPLPLPIILTNPGQYKSNRPLFQKYSLRKYQLYDTNYLPDLSKLTRVDEQLAYNMQPPIGVFEQSSKIVIENYRLLEIKDFKITLINPSERYRFCVEEIFIDSQQITRQQKKPLPFCLNSTTKYPFFFSLYITEHKPLIFKGTVYFILTIYDGNQLVDQKIWPKQIIVKVTHNHLRLIPLEIRGGNNINSINLQGPTLTNKQNINRPTNSIIMLRNPQKWDLSLVIIYKRKLYQITGQPIDGSIIIPAGKSYKFIIDGKDSKMTVYTKAISSLGSVAPDITYPILYVPIYCLNDLVIDYFNIGILSDDRSLVQVPVSVSSFTNKTVYVKQIQVKGSTQTVQIVGIGQQSAIFKQNPNPHNPTQHNTQYSSSQSSSLPPYTYSSKKLDDYYYQISPNTKHQIIGRLIIHGSKKNVQRQYFQVIIKYVIEQNIHNNNKENENNNNNKNPLNTDPKTQQNKKTNIQYNEQKTNQKNKNSYKQNIKSPNDQKQKLKQKLKQKDKNKQTNNNYINEFYQKQFQIRQTRTTFHYCEMRSPISVGSKRYIDIFKLNNQNNNNTQNNIISSNAFPIRNNLNLPINLMRVIYDQTKFKLLWLQDKRDYIFPNHQRDQFSFQYIGPKNLQVSPVKYVSLLQFNGNLFIPLEIVVYDRSLQCVWQGVVKKCDSLEALGFGYFNKKTLRQEKQKQKFDQERKQKRSSPPQPYTKKKHLTVRNWNPQSKNVKIGIQKSASENLIIKYGFNCSVKILGPFPEYDLIIKTQGRNLYELYLKGNHYIIAQIQLAALNNATQQTAIALAFRIITLDYHTTLPLTFTLQIGTIALIPQILRFDSSFKKTIEYINLVSTYKSSYKIKSITSNISNLMIYCNNYSEIYQNQWIGMAVIYEPYSGEWNMTEECCGEEFLAGILPRVKNMKRQIKAGITLKTNTDLETNATILINLESPALIHPIVSTNNISPRQKFLRNSQRIDINLINQGKNIPKYTYNLKISNQYFDSALKGNIFLLDEQVLQRLQQYLEYQKVLTQPVTTFFCLRNDIKSKHSLTASIIKSLFNLQSLPLQLSIQPLTNLSYYISSPIPPRQQILQSKYFSQYFKEIINSGGRVCYKFQTYFYIKNLIETGVVNFVSEQYKIQVVKEFVRREIQQAGRWVRKEKQVGVGKQGNINVNGQINKKPNNNNKPLSIPPNILPSYSLQFQQFYFLHPIDRSHFCKGPHTLSKMTMFFKFCQFINIKWFYQPQQYQTIIQKNYVKYQQCNFNSNSNNNNTAIPHGISINEYKKQCRLKQNGKKMRKINQKIINKYFVIPQDQQMNIKFQMYPLRRNIDTNYGNYKVNGNMNNRNRISNINSIYIDRDGYESDLLGSSQSKNYRKLIDNPQKQKQNIKNYKNPSQSLHNPKNPQSSSQPYTQPSFTNLFPIPSFYLIFLNNYTQYQIYHKTIQITQPKIKISNLILLQENDKYNNYKQTIIQKQQFQKIYHINGIALKNYYNNNNNNNYINKKNKKKHSKYTQNQQNNHINSVFNINNNNNNNKNQQNIIDIDNNHVQQNRQNKNKNKNKQKKLSIKNIKNEQQYRKSLLYVLLTKDNQIKLKYKNQYQNQKNQKLSNLNEQDKHQKIKNQINNIKQDQQEVSDNTKKNNKNPQKYQQQQQQQNQLQHQQQHQHSLNPQPHPIQHPSQYNTPTTQQTHQQHKQKTIFKLSQISQILRQQNEQKYKNLYIFGQKTFQLLNQGQADIIYTHIGFQNQQNICKYNGISIQIGPCNIKNNNKKLKSSSLQSNKPKQYKIKPDQPQIIKISYQIPFKQFIQTIIKQTLNSNLNQKKNIKQQKYQLYRLNQSSNISIYLYNSQSYYIKLNIQFFINNQLFNYILKQINQLYYQDNNNNNIEKNINHYQDNTIHMNYNNNFQLNHYYYQIIEKNIKYLYMFINLQNQNYYYLKNNQYINRNYYHNNLSITIRIKQYLIKTWNIFINLLAFSFIIFVILRFKKENQSKNQFNKQYNKSNITSLDNYNKYLKGFCETEKNLSSNNLNNNKFNTNNPNNNSSYDRNRQNQNQKPTNLLKKSRNPKTQHSSYQWSPQSTLNTLSSHTNNSITPNNNDQSNDLSFRIVDPSLYSFALTSNSGSASLSTMNHSHSYNNKSHYQYHPIAIVSQQLLYTISQQQKKSSLTLHNYFNQSQQSQIIMKHQHQVQFLSLTINLEEDQVDEEDGGMNDLISRINEKKVDKKKNNKSVKAFSGQYINSNNNNDKNSSILQQQQSSFEFDLNNKSQNSLNNSQVQNKLNKNTKKLKLKNRNSNNSYEQENNSNSNNNSNLDQNMEHQQNSDFNQVSGSGSSSQSDLPQGIQVQVTDKILSDSNEYFGFESKKTKIKEKPQKIQVKQQKTTQTSYYNVFSSMNPLKKSNQSSPFSWMNQNKKRSRLKW